MGTHVHLTSQPPSIEKHLSNLGRGKQCDDAKCPAKRRGGKITSITQTACMEGACVEGVSAEGWRAAIDGHWNCCMDVISKGAVPILWRERESKKCECLTDMVHMPSPRLARVTADTSRVKK